MEDAGLTMWHGLRLELVSYTCHSRAFLGSCENIKIVIGELRIKHPIFVIEIKDHNLILRQLFLNHVKSSEEYKLDEIFDIIISVFQMLISQNSINQIKNQISLSF